MKNKKKKSLKISRIIIILVIMVVIILGVYYLYSKLNKQEEQENEINNTDIPQANVEEEEFVQVLDDGTKVNVSSKLNETKVFNGLEVSNIRLTVIDGQTILLADIKNNSEKDIDVTLIKLILLDKNGNTYKEMDGIISPTKRGETTNLEISTTLDFANAYDFKIEIL